MIPYYSEKEKHCEHCDGEIYIGYEFHMFEGQFFCDNGCLMEHMKEQMDIRQGYLTDDKIYKEVD